MGVRTDGCTERQTDGQEDYYKPSADFVWWGTNKADSKAGYFLKRYNKARINMIHPLGFVFDQ